jgi:hypothetical protein
MVCNHPTVPELTQKFCSVSRPEVVLRLANEKKKKPIQTLKSTIETIESLVCRMQFYGKRAGKFVPLSLFELLSCPGSYSNNPKARRPVVVCNHYLEVPLRLGSDAKSNVHANAIYFRLSLLLSLSLFCTI